MDSVELPILAGKLGAWLGAEVLGDTQREVSRLSPLGEAAEGSLTFCAERKRLRELGRLRGAVVVTSAELVVPNDEVTYLVVPHPKQSFSRFAKQFRQPHLVTGIHSTAVIGSEVQLGAGVAVGAHAVLESGVQVGAGSVVGAQCYLGEGVVLGEQVVLYPGVRILARARLGDRVTVFPGTVIGGDGFGFQPGADGLPVEVPQVGSVVVESDVRIGSNCTIDRGAIGDTHIGAGTKLDCLVHIAHNVRVGRGSLICAQVGVAGSTVLGEGVVLGGQAGVSDGLKIGAGARVGGGAKVLSSVPAGETHFLYPALPMEKALQCLKVFRKLPDLWERLKRLEEKVHGGA